MPRRDRSYGTAVVQENRMVTEILIVGRLEVNRMGFSLIILVLRRHSESLPTPLPRLSLATFPVEECHDPACVSKENVSK
jgi:hypothetical protein